MNPINQREFGYVANTFVGELKRKGLPWCVMPRQIATFHLHSLTNNLLRTPGVQSHCLRDEFGAMIAYCLYEEVGNILYLHYIHVRYNHHELKRRTGIADKLLSEIFAEYSQHNFACTQYSTSALKLIERYGITYDPTYFYAKHFLTREYAQ
jgi:hypothetical protein